MWFVPPYTEDVEALWMSGYCFGLLLWCNSPLGKRARASIQITSVTGHEVPRMKVINIVLISIEDSRLIQ